MASNPMFLRRLAHDAFVVAFAIACLVWLECAVQPQYFSWDDACTLLTPFFYHNYQTFSEFGQIPLMNYHQWLGAPHLATGSAAALYPPSYIAAWLSETFFGNPLWTSDFFVAMHLLAAAFFARQYMRIKGYSDFLSSCGAIFYFTIPFSTIVSRSWGVIAYGTCFFPLLLFLIEKLIQHPSWGRILVYSIVKTALFFTGYVQYYFTISLFELIYLLLRMREINREKRWSLFFKFIWANIFSLILALPLLLPMMEATKLAYLRNKALPITVTLAWSIDPTRAILAQFFIFSKELVFNTGYQAVFIGCTIPLALMLVKLRKRVDAFSHKHVSNLILLLMITAASTTLLHAFFYFIPPLYYFRYPVKLYVFFTLFAVEFFILTASIGLKLGLFRKAVILAAVIVSTGLNLFVVSYPKLLTEHSNFRFDGFYEDASWIKRDGRIFPYLRDEPTKRDIYHVSAISFNHATLHGAYGVGGYDVLANRLSHDLSLKINYTGDLDHDLTQVELDHLSLWACKYLTADPRNPATVQHLSIFPQLRRIYSSQNVVVFENQQAKPFAYFGENPEIPLPVRFEGNRVVVDIQGKTGTLIVNVTPLNDYLFYVDGQKFPLSVNSRQQPFIVITTSASQVALAYQGTQFTRGSLIAGSVLGIAVLGWIFSSFFGEKFVPKYFKKA